MVPFWKNANGIFLVPSADSNPMFYYMQWVFDVSNGGVIGKIINDAYTNGINCPYEIDQWQYEWGSDLYVDTTLTVTCTD